MRYTHRFTVRAPLAKVAAFHRRAASMAAITPPPIIVQMHRAPVELADGAEVAFTLWLGPLPLRWQALMDQVSDHGFRDRMLSGPFASWVHQHRFIPLDGQTTEVVDEIEASLPAGFSRRVVALGMWLGMPLLFAYRAWRTRRLLEPTTQQSDT
ncbi:MAG TPA: hypothetical protein VNK95_06720 [Caldilineaceae bacterium]|nr:hypothetical protein [Caldilineaceae bacterium]